MEEFKEDKSFPSDVVRFLDQICQRRFLTDAGQKLYAANLGRILALAEEDVKNGDEAFPLSAYAEFLIPENQKNSSQSIN